MRGPQEVVLPAAGVAVTLRAARTSDVRAIRRLVDTYAPDRRLLSKATVTLYEDVQEFVVAERSGVVVGCGALHVMWEDLAEVRTVAVDPGVARARPRLGDPGAGCSPARTTWGSTGSSA